MQTAPDLLGRLITARLSAPIGRDLTKTTKNYSRGTPPLPLRAIGLLADTTFSIAFTPDLGAVLVWRTARHHRLVTGPQHRFRGEG
ncbi:hypothetical protein GCM10018952_76810 [Streptosporangium vulgare]